MMIENARIRFINVLRDSDKVLKMLGRPEAAVHPKPLTVTDYQLVFASNLVASIQDVK